MWPWVYIAYRRVLTNLRAKYRGQEVRLAETGTPSAFIHTPYIILLLPLVLLLPLLLLLFTGYLEVVN